MTTSVISQTNRTLAAKNVNDFHCSFLLLPENVSNVLGRQIRAIDRPSLQFDQIPIGQKNVKQQTVGAILFDPLQMEFLDDANSLVLTALYSQMFRQAGHRVNKNDKVGDDARFEIKVDVYSPDETIVESFKLLNCLITAITSSQAIYSSSEPNIISVTVVYDMVDTSIIHKIEHG